MHHRTAHACRRALQRLALAFLERQQNAGAECAQALFSRTARHLQLAHGVAPELAHVIAGSAYGQWRGAGERRYLDLASSSPTVVALTDPASGLTYMVPVSAIAHLMIDAPGRRHLHGVGAT